MTRCLVVDDDREIRDGVQTYLSRFGIIASTAASGAEMRRVMRAADFDVIVLDLMLPDENGLDLCPWAKQLMPALPVIISA